MGRGKFLLVMTVFAIMSAAPSFAAGRRTIYCQDNQKKIAVELLLTNAPYWYGVTTIFTPSSKLKVYQVRPGDELDKLDKERLASPPRRKTAIVKWNQAIAGNQYINMYFSRTYEYYIGLETERGTDYKKHVLYDKVRGSVIHLNCDITQKP